MKDKQPYDLKLLKKATLIMNCLGFTVFLLGIIATDFNYKLVLSFLGLAIMISSMVTFGFGMFLYLMAETSDKSKGNNTYPRKENLYFLEKQKYYYK